jgi:hypothetical protein
MKNTFEIVGTHTTAGDKFFTVAITNKEGETHTDLFSEITLLKAAQKGINFAVDMDNEEVVWALEEIGYITISEEQGFDDKMEFDVYFHKVSVDEYLIIDFGGEALKTLKTEKAALKFAAKQSHKLLA